MVGNLKLITVISIPKELALGKENTEKHEASFFNLDIQIRMESFKLVSKIKATNFCFLLLECPTTQVICHLAQFIL